MQSPIQLAGSGNSYPTAGMYGDGDAIDASRATARPKLVYVVNSLNPGGTEKLVVEMSLAFAPTFDLEVVCLDEPGLWAATLRGAGIPVHCLWRQPGLDLAIPVKLARHFRRTKARIVHAHQCTAWFYAALSRILEAAPKLVLEEHGRFFPEVKNTKRIFVNRLLARHLTHRFVAVSEDIRVRLQQYEGLDAEQTRVIYNGVKVEPLLSGEARDALRLELGFEPGSFVVGTVGRFDPIKNLPMLIGGIARASGSHDGLRGLLVGDGPVFPDVRALVEREGLSDRVRLTGFRGDARKLIQCMDLFVLSSFSEGTSMALLEAIASGVPVAVTDVGGNPEVVVNGKTGWVVPSGSMDALSAVIVECMENAGKRREFAAAGQGRFEALFTFDRMIDNYREQYRSLLEAHA